MAATSEEAITTEEESENLGVEVKAVEAGTEAEALLLAQMVSHLREERVGRIVLGAEQQHREVGADLLQPGPDGELLIVGEGRADDGQVITARGTLRTT